MKIAVLSDIHGNLPALQAVVQQIESWRPDKVIVNGDIVNRGPRSRDCLRLLLHKQAAEGWLLLRGNHEEYLLECARPDFAAHGPAFEVSRFAYWAYQQLNGEMAALAQMARQYSWLAPDGSEFRAVHAAMGDNRHGLYAEMGDAALRALIAPAPAVYVTAHTHQPFVRRLDRTLVVNVGSVGAPFDLDWRASYGRFTWSATTGWRARIVRTPYDRAQIERDYAESGFLDEGGPLAQLMLVELRRARGLLYRWASQYETAVRRGEISMETSVRQLLQAKDLRPYLGPPGWTLNGHG